MAATPSSDTRGELLAAFKANVPNVHVEEGCIESIATIDMPDGHSIQPASARTPSVVLTDCTTLSYVRCHAVVVETPQFRSDVKSAGLSDQQRIAIIDQVAATPMAGDLIQGTGGARKVRFAGRGKGRSAGYRVITFYGGRQIPVFLLAL